MWGLIVTYVKDGEMGPQIKQSSWSLDSRKGKNKRESSLELPQGNTAQLTLRF
jgi:hypothetical protein